MPTHYPLVAIFIGFNEKRDARDARHARDVSLGEERAAVAARCVIRLLSDRRLHLFGSRLVDDDDDVGNDVELRLNLPRNESSFSLNAISGVREMIARSVPNVFRFNSLAISRFRTISEQHTLPFRLFAIKNGFL